jgi:acyl carrier protein
MTGEEVESIGTPIANTQLYILNADGQPVPAGCTGELYLGGKGVALGYINNPALTAEKFIADPFTVGGRLYRTGDLASWLPDGRVLFHGRADNQVKIRGHRVELSEIEQVLIQHEAVNQCVLMITETTPGDGRLIAFIPDSAYADRLSLTEHLQNRLPDYMIPATWVPVNNFPLTVNGKIDHKQLLQLLEAGNSSHPITLPRNAMEQQLADAWKELLGLQEVGVYDDFFQLGGNSLLAIRLLSFLREQFSLNIPMTILFDITTIAGLADYIYVATEEPVQRHDLESEELFL